MPSKNSHQLDLLAGYAGGSLGEVERWASSQGYKSIIGIDEAGRGPLAGPVVAAAVCLNLNQEFSGLDDSKKLTAQKREELFPIIKSQSIAWAASFGMHTQIDQINILQSTLRNMVKAMELVYSRAAYCNKNLTDSIIIIDGNQKINTKRLQRTVVGGDSLSVSVAAASVIAKVLRDRWMVCASHRWPGYGFEKHKGYGTKEHLKALKKIGVCEIHRRTYKPVKECLQVCGMDK